MIYIFSVCTIGEDGKEVPDQATKSRPPLKRRAPVNCHTSIKANNN